MTEHKQVLHHFMLHTEHWTLGVITSAPSNLFFQSIKHFVHRCAAPVNHTLNYHSTPTMSCPNAVASQNLIRPTPRQDGLERNFPVSPGINPIILLPHGETCSCLPPGHSCCLVASLLLCPGILWMMKPIAYLL